MFWRLRRLLSVRLKAKLMQGRKQASNSRERETILKSKSRVYRMKINDFSTPSFDTQKSAPTNQSAYQTMSRPICPRHQPPTTTLTTSTPFAMIKRSLSSRSRHSEHPIIRIRCTSSFRMPQPADISWKRQSQQMIASSLKCRHSPCRQFLSTSWEARRTTSVASRQTCRPFPRVRTRCTVKRRTRTSMRRR